MKLFQRLRDSSVSEALRLPYDSGNRGRPQVALEPNR